MEFTSDTLSALKRPFAQADHEFLQGFVYITEEAITARIEEVDPAWEFNVVSASRADNQAICHARLTICGVTRDGIGMQKVIEKAGEPEKGAATDALKRAARLFGIGRYLLGAPKEGREFDQWLASEQKKAGTTPKLSILPPVTPVSTTQPSKADAILTELENGRSKTIQDAVAPKQVMTFNVTAIEVGRTDAGAKYLQFEALLDGGELVRAKYWGKTGARLDGLREAIGDAIYNKLAKDGIHNLDFPIAVVAEQDGQYWNAIKIAVADVVF